LAYRKHASRNRGKLNKQRISQFIASRLFVGCIVVPIFILALLHRSSKVQKLEGEIEHLAEKEVSRIEQFAGDLAQEETPSLRKRFGNVATNAERSFLHALLGDNSKMFQNKIAHDESKGKEMLSQDSSNAQNGGVKYYMVFSTGCSVFQNWQSYTFSTMP